ncbi:protein of unknown function [Taphrina deformans PYCC 5710]|uniref:Uncharacterized protein n=1 Tax=Taphrina deformans (strain PYCC 5710 / ATCC 11124 / CBS 356.35 / IMI 108563 / JCM 9778 / NBRC 8474) TaxID=1097556 RepID=R4X6S9_TAPDE|nr:protein of unknown function [Taphrina deformans PYCC 5710]|eukprot:CCG80911.1 protein of unknown function [Taphrina deformans PYCC 5710]
MTSYQTSAIASSDEDDDIVPDSIGLIIISSEPLDEDPYAPLEIPSHPLYDESLWSFPVIRTQCYVTSTPREYDPDSLHTLAAVAMDLVDRGAVVIVTGTGFSSMQRDLAARLPVPVLCSPMIQLSSLRLVSTGGVGVVTLDRQLVSSWNLVAVGAAPDTPVIGLSPSSLWRQSADWTRESQRLLQDLIEACGELISRHQVTSIVLEEPKFAIYTARIQDRLKSVRIFDVVTAVNWLYGGHRQSGASPGKARRSGNHISHDSFGRSELGGGRAVMSHRHDEERVEDASIIGDSSSPIIGSRHSTAGL